ncbi:MAG: B12-binding domain-containing radical SAM protein [Lachnospiraceae bacterium]|nr:B12-binding domain-containing radical SAM protein [Lachnospiraceae bacterium]
MKILLIAINAKYIHSNLAVYSLRSYAEKYRDYLELKEYTINHRLEYILQEIYKQQPDVLCFSCYIWNFRYVQELIAELHKLLPQTAVWVGGPEVSYEPELFLQENSGVTGVMLGEGEETFRELCGYYLEAEERSGLTQIAGLLFRENNRNLIRTPERPPLPMDKLPFCYEHLEEFQNRIIYYETSRGCPFSCSYCLSSIEKSLRFRSLSIVKKELQFFLDHRAAQVKFVDRTFNCSHEHAVEIWRYLLEHDNGITNFHFEISADLLTEEELTLLERMRPGLVQFEIGVQSTWGPTIQEIHRNMDIKLLEQRVKRIQQAGNIHQHLDLIAGLPKEDFTTFARSFCQVYRWKPQQLQLGFLKVLKGSYLYQHRKEYGLIYRDQPPYEVLATHWISYEEMLKIKLVEEMLEVYYNSGQFEMTMKVLELTWESPFYLFLELGQFYERKNLLAVSHSRIRRCQILLEFVSEKDPDHLELYQETLTFDLYYRENMKSRPSWAPDLAPYRDVTRTYCKKGKLSHLEPFWYPMEEIRKDRSLSAYPEKQKERQFYLFSYEEKNPLTGQAKAEKLNLG